MSRVDGAAPVRPFADVYPGVGRCPYGVRCGPGSCFEQERIDAEKRRLKAKEAQRA